MIFSCDIKTSHSMVELADRFFCALSIDLESWVHRQIGFSIDSNCKKKLDAEYIKRATLDILDLLNRYDRKVTFFIVSEIFDWYPDVIKSIKTYGHEIAYHTHTHRYIKTKQDLIEELRQSECFLDEFKPTGFRAPEATLKAECLGTLSDYGFKYDSSSYGTLSTSTVISGVREIPISTLSFFNSSNTLTLPRNITKSMLLKELPLGCGFFMSALDPAAKLLPNSLYLQNEVPVLFIHPWQIIPHDTDLSLSANSVFKRTALLLYSRKCLDSFLHILKNFQTICLKTLANNLSDEDS